MNKQKNKKLSKELVGAIEEKKQGKEGNKKRRKKKKKRKKKVRKIFSDFFPPKTTWTPMGAELRFIRMKTLNKFSPIGALVGAGSHRPCDRALSRGFQRYQKRSKEVPWFGRSQGAKQTNKHILSVEIVKRGT